MAAKGKTQQPLEVPTRRVPRDVVWTAASAVGLIVCATGIFVAGFFTQDLTNNGGHGGAAVAQATRTPSAQATPQASPTPPAVVQVSADDAPAWGPQDAKVTIVEFSDYQ